jgi:hypothetical protein
MYPANDVYYYDVSLSDDTQNWCLRTIVKNVITIIVLKLE